MLRHDELSMQEQCFVVSGALASVQLGVELAMRPRMNRHCFGCADRMVAVFLAARTRPVW
jgi:hypothetical protein